MKPQIPADAKLVHKGIIFDVYQWQQKMFDGSYETFEMLKRVDTVNVIAVQGNKILITYQSQVNLNPTFGMFGGRVDRDEKQLDAAKRELLEEGGLESDDWELWKVSNPSEKIVWTSYTFIARNCRKVSEPHVDSGEKIEIKECTLDEFIDVVLSDNYRDFEIVADIAKIKVDASKRKEFAQKLSLYHK
jgi:ADP-ribose pyrophosphatase